MKSINLLLSLALLLFTSAVSSQTQKQPFSIGHTEKFYSKLLDGNSTLIVSLPENYDSSNENYPLIIYLDGLTTAQITTGTHDVHWFANLVPDAIMVGIQPIDRNENYIPWEGTYFRTGGKADTYVKFIAEELIPYLDSTYRTQDYRTIIGGSLGGLFVLHTLMNSPCTFDCYLALSPACSFHNSQLIKNAESFFSQEIDLSKKYLFLSLANEGERMGVNNMADVIKESPANINWEFKHYPEEVHSSAGYKSIGDGFKFFYRNWNPDNRPVIEPMSDAILEGNSVEVTISNNKLKETRYTLDGSEPTNKSPLYTNPITVNKNTTVKAKSFYEDGKHGFTATANFIVADYIEPSSDLPDLVNGLNYSYYEGEWYKMPEFEKLEALKSGTCETFDLKISERDDYFGFVFSGYINIPKDGKYTFSLNSDDAAQLLINNKLIIDDVYSQYGQEKQASIFLKKGMHPIVLKYYENIWGENLQLMFESQEIKKQVLDSKILYRSKK